MPTDNTYQVQTIMEAYLYFLYGFPVTLYKIHN